MYDGKIIAIDDNKAVLQTLRLLLSREFRTVLTVADPVLLPALLRAGDVDMVLLDMNFGAGKQQGEEGLFWLKRIREAKFPPEIILITAYGDIPLAVESLKNGAADFIQKPWDNEKLVRTVVSVYEKRRQRQAAEANGGASPELLPVELLLNALLKKYAQSYAKPLPHLTDAAFRKLSALAQSVGLSALENTIERALLLKESRLLDASDFEDAQPAALSAPCTLEEMEKQFIATVLKEKERNLTLVAQELGISRQTLYNKMRKYDL